MKIHNIRLIFMREVRDQLRDRRTLFMIAVLPLLLPPAMGIGLLEMTLLSKEQQGTVVILGAEDLPLPSLLDGHSFETKWFHNPANATKLRVITDLSVAPGGDNGDNPDAQRLVKQAQELRPLVEARGRTDTEVRQLLERLRSQPPPTDASASDLPGEKQAAETTQQLARLQTELAAIDAKLSERFVDIPMQVLIVVPRGLKADVERVNRLLTEKTTTAGTDLSYAHPTILKNRADDKSSVAFGRVQDVFEAWQNEILRQRLNLAGLPAELPTPVAPEVLDIAAPDQVSANFWSKLFPAVLVMMAVMGAFHPAVDLAAGEKERGTMETLLICPATRSDIVLGKFFTVMCFSVSNVVLNLLSFGITFYYVVTSTGGIGSGPLSQAGSITLPTLPALGWLLVLLLPLSALFSALSLAFATFARSSKEGQYYLIPLMMVSLSLTGFSMTSLIELSLSDSSSWFYSVIPIVGIVLLLKALLLNPDSTSTLIFVVPVLVTSIAYSLVALWWAIEQFSREDVLFREGERFELRLWIKHLLREKEPTPNFTEAAFCFVLIMLAQFVSFRAFGQSIASVAPSQIGVEMMKLLVIQQLAIIAAPAMFMGLILTTSVWRTFKLSLPNGRYLAIAVALPFALHPLSLELMASLDWFFPHLPEGASRLLKMLSDHSQPLWLIVLSFAVVPGLCEELAFRGFILTGLQRSGRNGLAIGLSALLFGVMHLIPQQVFNASLLGLVLGLIAVRSGSLLPGILFHAIYNSLAVVRERLGAALSEDPAAFQNSVLPNLLQLDAGSIRYTWLTLIICGVAACAALYWLIRDNKTKVENETSWLP